METAFGSILAQHAEELRLRGKGLPLGFPKLQEIAGYGLLPGRVYMLMARTGVGKSALACNIAVNAQLAAPQDITAFASLEMRAGEVAARMLSAVSDVGMDEVEASMAAQNPQSVITDGLGLLGNIHIRDNPAPRWVDLSAWVQELEKDTGQKVQTMFLDHLLLMGEGGTADSVPRVQQLGRDAKVFAKQHKLGLVVLHQTGRGDESGKDNGQKPLSLSSGMWGGEQDMDLTIGMYRPYLNPLLSLQASEACKYDVYLQILKNRHGPIHPKGMLVNWSVPSMKMTEVTV